MGLFSRSKSKNVVNGAGPPRVNGTATAVDSQHEEHGVSGASPPSSSWGPERSRRNGEQDPRQAVAGASVPGALPTDSGSTNTTWRAATPDLPESVISSRPKYRFEPLREQEIRLFLLRRGGTDDGVQIQIQHCAIDKTPSYIALSFAWGNATDRGHVLVADKALTVTLTLETALKGVRLASQDLLMWADQICIDQSDDEEKTQQVNYMSVIYPRARIVACWLGEDDGTVETAFAVLSQWSAARGKGRSKQNTRIKLAAATARQLSQKSNVQDAMQRLFARPWWRRAWTLQEVRPSQTNSPILICGQHRLSWLDFYDACDTMFSTLAIAERDRAFSLDVQYVLPMLAMSWATQENTRLTHLVQVTAHREATDPRDKIFALLGMTAAAGLQYPRADYSLSAAEVCIRYTRAMIEVDRSLGILYRINREAADKHLPTWAIKLDRMASETLGMDFPLRNSGPLSRNRFNATLGHDPMIDAASDIDEVLRLGGTPLDVVDYRIAGRPSGEHTTWAQMLDQVAEFARCQNLPDLYKPSNCGMVEALLKTLTVENFYVTSKRSPPSTTIGRHASTWAGLYASYQRYLTARNATKHAILGLGLISAGEERFFDYVQNHFTFRYSAVQGQEGCGTAHLRRERPLPNAWLDRRILTDLDDLIDRVSLGGRSLFMTTKGYIGLGPRDARRGDEVCLLFGATAPFLLRPVQRPFGRGYELLDEVYREGFMMGEGLRDFGSNEQFQAPPRGWTRYALV